MGRKSARFILVVGFFVMLTNTLKAQTTSKQIEKTEPSPQSSRIDRIEDKLNLSSEKLSGLEARERALTQAYIDHMNWFIGILIAFPTVAGIFFVILKKSIVKELTEEAGEKINKSIKLNNLKIKEITKSLHEFKSAREIDDLANKQLDLGLNAEQVEELKILIREAPDLTKDIVFYRARDFLLTRLKEGKFEEIEKASCIFQSIIDGDYNRPEFFRSRAYLSYIFAYHDYYDSPNYSKLEEAKKLISEAIKIRDYLEKDNTELYFYEFKRAIYNLHILEKNCFPENSKIHKEIARDLKDSRKYSLIDTIKEEIKSGKDNLDFQKRYISKQDTKVLKKWWSKYE